METDTNQTYNFNSVLDDAKRVITNPKGFYQNMPTSGGYTNPLIFVAVMAAITGLIIAVLSMIGLGGFGGVTAGGIAALGAVIMFPIMAVIGSFIFAVILFVIWRLLGSDKDFEVAYRCVAYTVAIAPIIALVSFIPYLGGIIKTLWICYLLFLASTEVHKLNEGTAKLVFGILAGIFLLFGLKGEHAARNFKAKWERSAAEMKLPESMKDIENMTPEEIGKSVGEFMKGFEEAAKEMEKAQQKSD